MKKITIKDVARESGVSVTIASFALNDVKGRVSGEVRAKVLECAERLGYIPNTFAQSLRTRNSKTIGLIYDEAYLEERNASTLQLVSSSIKYAGEKGRDILIKLINMGGDMGRQIAEFSELWDSQKVAGLMFQCSRIEPLLLEKMKRKDVNFVVIPAIEKIKVFDVNTVYIDNYKLMKDGIRYIYEKGYSEIYFLTLESRGKTERETGYLDALMELGLKGEPLYYKSRYRGKGEVWDVIGNVVENRKNRIALACWNDVDAINVIDILHSKGIKIRDEVGVMGFDDIPASEHTYPPLTTIRQPFDIIARNALDILIADHESGKTDKPVSIEIPGQIVERESI